MAIQLLPPLDPSALLGLTPDPAATVAAGQQNLQTELSGRRVEGNPGGFEGLLKSLIGIGPNAEQINRERLAAQAQLQQQRLEAAHAAAMANPTGDNYRRLFIADPEHYQATKAAFDSLNEEQQRRALEDWSAAKGYADKGDWEGYKGVLQRRIDADKAAGKPTADDEHMLALADDPQGQARIAPNVGYHLAAAMGAEHYNEAFAADQKAQELATQAATQAETARHDVAGEAHDAAVAAETARHNAAEEGKPVEVGKGASLVDPGTPGATGPAVGGVTLQPPVQGPISSGFGQRTAPMAGASTNHKGEDFAVPIGTPVAASAPGRVTFAGKRGGLGNAVVVDHGGGVETVYGHLSSVGVKPGDQVTGGQVIGASGDTGIATGPNLHWEVRQNGTPVNPRAPVGRQARVLFENREAAGWRPSTPEELASVHLPPGTPAQTSPDGKVEPLPGTSVNLKPLPASVGLAMADRRQVLGKIDRALALVRQHPNAVGIVAYAPNEILQRAGPGGVDTRASVGDIGSQIIHDRSGAAVTFSETPRLKPFVPQTTDSAETIVTKLTRLRENVSGELGSMQEEFGPDSGYRQPGGQIATAPDASKPTPKGTANWRAGPGGQFPVFTREQALAASKNPANRGKQFYVEGADGLQAFH